jgi:tetratricopeptide (TPR) repeat protein
MELRLKPIDHNPYTLGGILIQGAAVEGWIKEIQRIGLALSATRVYPIPHTRANTIWGCLVVWPVEKGKWDIGRNRFCQVVNQQLFIPEHCDLYPRLLAGELEKLLGGKKHILHPEFGWVELAEEIEWTTVIDRPQEQAAGITRPVSSLFIPTQIRTFQIKPMAPEASLEALEAQHFPKQEAFKDKPLNPLEKAKLFLYKQLFTRNGTTGKANGDAPEKTPLLSKLESLGKLFTQKPGKWVEDMQEDFEDLERRNQKQLDRLMELFKTNPEEALKYAIPLDNDGVSMGGQNGRFTLDKRWGDFSLFGRSSGGSGSVVMPDNAYSQLYAQYLKTAQELSQQKEYKKAAFVYMKLLKNYPMAAQSLESGGLYQEAASVYLKYCHDKAKAAACYEKGSMPLEAIELYKELGEDERVGDLYTSIHRHKEAGVYYQKVADAYVHQYKHVKAALLYKNKMNNPEAAQGVLLEGWRANRDAFNCLNSYLAAISNEKQLWATIQQVYQQEVRDVQKETFLRVLKYEYDKQYAFSEGIKDMAYEIIVEQVPTNPSLVSELRSFNQKDKQLLKDTMRFKLKSKKNIGR